MTLGQDTSTPHAALPPAVAAWSLALDAIERDLLRIEAALDAGEEIEASPWSPPAGLGPLPEHLREHAIDVLGRLRDLTDELRDSRSASLGELHHARQHRQATAAYHAVG